MEQNEQQQNSQRRSKKSLLLLVLLLLLVSVTIGYAVLSTSLNIRGSSTIQGETWKIEVPSISCPAGQKCTIDPEDPEDVDPEVCTDANATTCKGAIIWMDGDTIYFKHILTKPGDVFTFNATFKNSGTIDAKVKNVTKSELNATAKQFMTYDVTYADGTPIAADDVLNAGQSANYKVTVTYKSTVTTLPTEAELALINETADGHTGATSLFTVTYEQK